MFLSAWWRRWKKDLSVFQFIFENFDWGREVDHFLDPIRGDEGADTDLMFQFYLPDVWSKQKIIVS